MIIKNSLLIVILSLDIFNLFSQPFGYSSDGYRIIMSEYSNSSGEEGKTYFNYDRDGVLYRSFWTLNNHERNSVNYYEYDENGNLLVSFRDFSDSLFSTEIFAYDDTGNKISELFFRSDSVNGDAQYFYKNGLLTGACFNKYKGWLSGDLKYYYDERNQLNHANLFRVDDTICTINYEYNEEGNRTRETWDFQGKWKQEFTYVYERAENWRIYYSSPWLRPAQGYRISKEEYSYNNESSGPSFYSYNDSGNLKSKEFVRSDSLRTITNYFHNYENKLELSQRKYSDGRSGKFVYHYDDSDNLIFKQFFLQDTLNGIETYYYDSENMLKRAYLKNFDGWLTGTLIFKTEKPLRFPYPDKPQYADFHGDNGFDAKVFFRYNENFCLKEVLWKFSFGKFQQYKYEYEKTR